MFQKEKDLECDDVYKIKKILFPNIIINNFPSPTSLFQPEQKNKTWVIKSDEERYAESDHKIKLNRVVYRKPMAHSIILNWLERNRVGNPSEKREMMAWMRGRIWSIWRLNQIFLFLKILFLIIHFF